MCSTVKQLIGISKSQLIAIKLYLTCKNFISIYYLKFELNLRI